MLQIGEDVDYLLIPREVRLAGGVWRVISKPATKEAEFRERLTQFLEEEGRTLEDVARIIEKSTPHPPQPPKKPKEPRVRRRVQQMVTPTPRLVVGTYDSSNASDSEFSDFETSRDKSRQDPRRGKKVRKMPVSYLGSKFLGSDVESEDDEELVEAFLRRQEKQPTAPPARRRVNLPVPMFEDNLGPQLSKADRWREYVSQVSWGKLKRRVKGWAPRAGPGVGEARLASTPVESAGVSSGTSPGDRVENAGDVCAPQASPRRWRPKINWASFRRRRKEQTAPTGQGADIEADQGGEAADNQREEAIADQGEEAAGNQRAGAPADQGAEDADNHREEAADNQRAEAPADQGEEAADNQRAGAPADHRPQGADNFREEAPADQGSEATDNQREEAIHDQRERAPAVQGADNQRAQARAGQRAEAAHNQRAGAPGIQEAEASAAQGATGTASGARARKQVKTVRFQTPGRFSWFRKHRRAFWHTPRLPTLPKRVPRAGEARNLRVLRAEARAEAEQGEQEDQL
ncbi:PREDICTED: coiled-coil domain-containing protein 8 [Colobus angolensis palliatus]|uniref:coiled-coil domain-containing protein 8 n=1 Tax=Colobus angolensis palliatus TaxID=336983 RepID=UPI0005F5531D|nr:PREDICTED: coiled-coil domain-containing protein 8 [Colobus angolensis palliatus]